MMEPDPPHDEVEILPPKGVKNAFSHGTPSAGAARQDFSQSSRPANSPVNQEGLMRVIAHLMDNAFSVPGTKFRFGLDPILGLIPGFGDTLTALISAMTLMHGARMGLPKIVIARMSVNILVNSIVGAIPLAGDAFSFWFKSNQRNYELFQKHIGSQRPSTYLDWVFVVVMLLAIAAVIFGVVALIVYLTSWLFHQGKSGSW